MEKTPKVTLSQFFFLVVQTQVGIAILSLPFVAFQESKWDGWISILFSGVAIHLISSLLFIFSRTEYTVGKIEGTILTLAYIVYLIFIIYRN